MFGFGPKKQVPDFQFALEAFMRMVAGAYLSGGRENVSTTLNDCAEISETNVSETPRGEEIHFSFKKPFDQFSGFVDMPEKVDFIDFSVNLSGHGRYSGFGASLTDHTGQVAVYALGSALNRPTKLARHLASEFERKGAIDVGVI